MGHFLRTTQDLKSYWIMLIVNNSNQVSSKNQKSLKRTKGGNEREKKKRGRETGRNRKKIRLKTATTLSILLNTVGISCFTVGESRKNKNEGREEKIGMGQ